MLKDKCVVFGAGKNTRKYIASIEDRFDIIAVADNNSSLWGKSINDYEVISPTDIVNSDCDCVVISVRRYHEVQRQLTDLGITNIIVLADGLLYKYGTDNLMEPLHFKDIPVPYKKGTEGMHVLFVQKRPLTRVFKISEMLCNLGISVSLAYVEDTPDEMRGYLRFYKNIVRVVSFDELIDYINKSDYDIVHCVNEPDEFTCVLCGINKPLVHDCSDFVSLRDEPNITKISLEYIANTKCDGYVYASENCRKLAMQRYGAREGNSIAIENRPSISAIPTCEMSKLSAKDNELHCVYEGGISSAPSYFRFFEDACELLISF